MSARKPCPGTGAIANCMEAVDWCPMCNRICRVRDDGTISRHPMKWDQIVAYMAELVRSLEVTEGCAMHEIAIRERRRRMWAFQ